MAKNKERKGINRRESIYVEKYDTYNFYITNFEPFQVQNLIEKYIEQQQDFYQDIQSVEKMQLDEASVLALFKVKDLHAFADSIIEVMIGKTSEDGNICTHEQEDENTDMNMKDSERLGNH